VANAPHLRAMLLVNPPVVNPVLGLIIDRGLMASV